MFSIKKVSELLDIPAVTIRAWENRYGIIAPVRTEGGHRLYSEDDIERLKWLKQQMQEKNIKISEAVHLLNHAYVSAAGSPASDEPQRSHRREDIMDKLYQSLIDLNNEQANEIIDLAFSLFNFEHVFHSILTPVLYRIGEQWEDGSITVAQEHFASELFLQRFHQFFRILPVHPRLPRALAFCPQGEHHHIGLMLFSLFLRNKGMDVIYLGPNTPYTGLTDLIAGKNISVVVVSLTSPKSVKGLLEWIESCRTVLPALRLALGGNGLQPCPQALLPYLLKEDYNEWEAWFRSTIDERRPT